MVWSKSMAPANLFAIECSPEKRVARRSLMEEAPMPHIINVKSPGNPRRLLAGVIAAATLSWPAIAENAAVPNFAPDSSTGWISGVPDSETPIGDEFIQPPSGPGPITFDRAHPLIDNRKSRQSGKSATNRVADLSNPILQPWAREELRKVNQRALTEMMLWTPKERCWPIGVPGWLVYPVRPLRFLQTPKQVVMIWEEDHMVRHVYLTDQHSPNVKPSWFGESIGHYENGDTLVVDTIGLNTRTFIDNYRTPHTEQLHVVERYRIVDDGKALEVTAYVEDPGAFTMPWTAVQRYRLNKDAPLAEEICAENNVEVFGADVEPIPTAHKPDF
jgi:hypothetical protein